MKARFAGTALFAAGLTLGLAVPRQLWPGASPSPTEVVRTGGTEPTAGRNGPPARRADGYERDSTSAPSRRLAEAKSERAAAATAPREIARRALDFTAFVRGKGVYGAGVLMDANGHVLTCWHVVDGLEDIQVSFVDGEPMPAKLLDHDKALDVALLKVDSRRIPGVKPASVNTLGMGDEVFAMGAPRKMSFSLSRGIVSYVGRVFDGVHYLQTDLPTNGGSSGGPVMNERGEVVGISSFILRNSQGLAFALPIDYALQRFSATLSETFDVSAFGAWVESRQPVAAAPSKPEAHKQK